MISPIRRADRGRVPLAGPDRGHARLQGPLQDRRRLPLVRGQVGVATGQGQAVGLAHDRTADDLDRERQVGHHLPDHRELLEVLLAEVGPAGPGDGEELGHDRGHPGEVGGPGRPLHRLREPAHGDRGEDLVGVHLVVLGAEEEVDIGRLGLRPVAIGVPGIGGQVLARSELQRVDEDRGHHEVGVGPGRGHQRQVPLVEVAHRRHQPDRGPLPPDLVQRPPHLRDAPAGLHAASLPVRRSVQQPAGLVDHGLVGGAFVVGQGGEVAPRRWPSRLGRPGP